MMQGLDFFPGLSASILSCPAFLHPPMSLTDLLTHTAADAGCENTQDCRQTLSQAAAHRRSMIEALLDSNLVDEDLFFQNLFEFRVTTLVLVVVVEPART